jgi:MFS family permease|tara:strand:- start:3916 stop:5127 length:1212 start_codon:yes stop_codon:yes gene_type:complete
MSITTSQPLLSDHYYRWVVVAYGVTIQAVSVGTLIYCFALFSLPWLEEFSSSRRDLMLTIALMQIGVGLVSPFVGRALDAYPPQWVVTVGLLSLVIGLTLAQHVTSLFQLWLVYATFMPLAMALMGSLTSQTLVTRWFKEQRGLALGISSMGTNIGGIILPLLVAGWLLEMGWRDVMQNILVLAVIVVLPATWLLLRRKPLASATNKQSNATDTRVWTTKEILTTSLFWLPFIGIAPLSMSFGALQFNLGIITRDIGLATEVTANLIALSSVSMVLGKLFFGMLGDRIDHRYLYWLANGIGLLALALIALADNVVTLTLATIAMGLSGGSILPLMGLIYSARFGTVSFGRVMGFGTLTILAGATSPIMAGWTYDVFASYNYAYVALALLLVPAAIAMVWLRKE